MVGDARVEGKEVSYVVVQGLRGSCFVLVLVNKVIS